MPRSLPLLFAAGLLWAGIAHADPSAQVRADKAWIRVLPADLPAGGYVTLHNTGDTAVALVGASSTRYGHVMLHQSSTEGGMGRMNMVERLAIPAHGSVSLAPGGYHLMLMHATPAVSPGDKVPVTLDFADGSKLAVDFLARPANAVDAGETRATTKTDLDHSMPPGH
ncbi:MAG TPA: copper chaperone PCu(A)C [Dyella sp.]|nr:copper chaperone PCu(A)C [Dyella sp.]